MLHVTVLDRWALIALSGEFDILNSDQHPLRRCPTWSTRA